jgi:hypothetical protein
VYIDFSQGYGNTNGGSLNNAENEIANLWLNYQVGFSVVTSLEVNNGAISLSKFRAVLPLNGVDANLTAYESGGGALLTQPEYPQTITVDLGSVQSIGSLTLDLPPSSAWTSAATNLALGRPATASSSYQTYAASNVTDGNTSSYWERTDGAGTRTQTLSVLGSTNGTSFSQIVGSAGYTFNPSTGNTVTISLPSGISARYVELSVTGNTGWPAAQLSEFEVFPGTGGGGGTSSPLTASPSSVSFSNTTVGSTSAPQTVTVSNPGSSAVSVSSVIASGPFSQTNTCGSSIAAGGSCTVSVRFTPTATGPASGSLSVSSSAPSSSNGAEQAGSKASSQMPASPLAGCRPRAELLRRGSQSRGRILYFPRVSMSCALSAVSAAGEWSCAG